MKGAIFYASKYGSTAQYARWIGEATSLPVFDTRKAAAPPSDFDFLVIGSPIIYHKLWFHRWLEKNTETILSRPTILFSVSGAGPGAKLDGWMGKSMPTELIDHMQHIALRGRQDPKELTRFDRMMLIIGGLMNRDKTAGRQEVHGFDFMDKESIEPIAGLVSELLGGQLPSTRSTAAPKA